MFRYRCEGLTPCPSASGGLRTPITLYTPNQTVRVDHGRSYVSMPKQPLDRANVVAHFQQTRSEAVTRY